MTSRIETSNIEQYRNQDLLDAVNLFISAARNLHNLRKKTQETCNHEHAAEIISIEHCPSPAEGIRNIIKRTCLNCGYEEENNTSGFQKLKEAKVHRVFSQAEKEEYWKLRY